MTQVSNNVQSSKSQSLPQEQKGIFQKLIDRKQNPIFNSKPKPISKEDKETIDKLAKAGKAAKAVHKALEEEIKPSFAHEG